MKLKLDENLGRQCADVLHTAGHDVATVAGQAMCGWVDPRLIDACRGEGRCLVTLDLDFANPLVFQPGAYCGIAVFRLPRRPSHDDLLAATRMLCQHLAAADIVGKLWIVERDRVREYQPDQ